MYFLGATNEIPPEAEPLLLFLSILAMLIFIGVVISESRDTSDTKITIKSEQEKKLSFIQKLFQYFNKN